MQLTQATQESLVALLCLDPEGAPLVESLVPLRFYDPIFHEFAEEAVRYRREFKRVPGEHTLDLLHSLTRKDKKREALYKALFDSIQETFKGLNREYVLKQATLFIRYQAVKKGVAKALEALEKPGEASVLEAEAALASAAKVTSEGFDPGTFLLDAKRSLGFLNQDHTAFHTGIKELDEAGLGAARKRLHVFVGLAGAGKSWWLVHLAKFAMMQRLKVLYVTLELDELEVSQRLIQSLFSVGKREAEHYRTLLEIKKGVIEGHKILEILKRPNLQNPKIADFLRKKLSDVPHKNPILVKQFPTGSLSPRELVAYLDALESYSKFVPDLILVDYADLMSPDEKFHEYRHAIGDIYKKLRGIAVERNIAIATASQSNRQGYKAKLITAENTAEDFSKIATADIVLTYNQTPMENELKLARLYVAKARTDADKYQVLISQAYSIGNFCIESWPMATNYFKFVEGASGVQEEEEYEEGE